MVKSTEQREQKAKWGPFFDDEIPGGKRHEDKKWAGVFAFFFLGEVGGSDMIQTQTTEQDSDWRILERRWIEKMKNKPALTVINRDDGVDSLTLWVLYFLLILLLIDTPFSHTHAIHLTHV